jgi:hypothetical protein
MPQWPAGKFAQVKIDESFLAPTSGAIFLAATALLQLAR